MVKGSTQMIEKRDGKASLRFGFLDTWDIITTMFLAGLSLAIGWTIITNPSAILSWFGL